MKTWMPIGSAAVLALVMLLTGACTPAPAPSPPVVVAPTPPAPTMSDQVEQFLGASRWGRYDRVSTVLVLVDGLPVVDLQRLGPPDRRREIPEVTATVLVALVGIVGKDGGLGDVQKPLAELLPDAPPELAGTTLHELLLGPSLDHPDLVARVLTHATGRPLPELARERLFTPLGIDPEWTDTPGPALTAPETAALASLWLDRGVVAGRQVVPAEWIEMATRPHTPTTRRRLPYAGYGMWVTRAGRHAATAVTGTGGHLIEVVPALDLVVVVVCDEDPTPMVAPPAPSEAFVEMVTSIVVPALD